MTFNIPTIGSKNQVYCKPTNRKIPIVSVIAYVYERQKKEESASVFRPAIVAQPVEPYFHVYIVLVWRFVIIHCCLPICASI